MYANTAMYKVLHVQESARRSDKGRNSRLISKITKSKYNFINIKNGVINV